MNVLLTCFSREFEARNKTAGQGQNQADQPDEENSERASREAKNKQRAWRKRGFVGA